MQNEICNIDNIFPTDKIFKAWIFLQKSRHHNELIKQIILICQRFPNKYLCFQHSASCLYSRLSRTQPSFLFSSLFSLFLQICRVTILKSSVTFSPRLSLCSKVVLWRKNNKTKNPYTRKFTALPIETHFYRWLIIMWPLIGIRSYRHKRKPKYGEY